MTDGHSPLARRVAELLRRTTAVENVRCLASRGPSSRDVDVVSFVPDHRPLLEYLAKEEVDTVIQCGLAADRSGRSARVSDPDVIATMCMGAAVGHPASRVRNWVLASSSDVYPIDSHSPLVHHEGQTVPHDDGSRAASIAEAEEYARDVALRLPHVNVAILRLQQIAGPDARGPLATLLGRSWIPMPVGFDATIQLLHVEDAARALAFAAEAELAGVYNVASAGTIHWSQAVRALRRPGFPVLPFTWPVLEPVLVRTGIPHVPADLVDLLRFGHTIDTSKLERAGWRPAFDQLDCLAALRAE